MVPRFPPNVLWPLEQAPIIRLRIDFKPRLSSSLNKYLAVSTLANLFSKPITKDMVYEHGAYFQREYFIIPNCLTPSVHRLLAWRITPVYCQTYVKCTHCSPLCNFPRNFCQGASAVHFLFPIAMSQYSSAYFFCARSMVHCKTQMAQCIQELDPLKFLWNWMMTFSSRLEMQYESRFRVTNGK